MLARQRGSDPGSGPPYAGPPPPERPHRHAEPQLTGRFTRLQAGSGVLVPLGLGQTANRRFSHVHRWVGCAQLGAPPFSWRAKRSGVHGPGPRSPCTQTEQGDYDPRRAFGYRPAASNTADTQPLRTLPGPPP
jgi:hypothetical protein